MKKELTNLGGALTDPKRRFVSDHLRVPGLVEDRT